MEGGYNIVLRLLGTAKCIFEHRHLVKLFMAPLKGRLTNDAA